MSIGSKESTPKVSDEVIPPRESQEGSPTASEVLTLRTRAMAATLIKERFQKLSAAIEADERDTKRAQLREESVRQLFKLVGIVPVNDSDAEQSFTTNYQSVEAAIPDMDKSHLVDLFDAYERHPAMGVFDTLSATSSIAKDDLVFMRRASLLLLEHYSPQQSE